MSKTIDNNQHPLRPLDAAEVQAAVLLLKSTPYFTGNSRIVSIMLREPRKEVVYKWSKDGVPPHREAIAVLHDNGANRASTVTMDLTANKVLDYVQAPEGVQAAFSMDEMLEVEEVVKASPLFKEALQRLYGVPDTALVTCDIWSVGYYGAEEERRFRLAKPICFLRADPTDNSYARPLEGIRPVVNVNTMQVIRVEEYGKWPLPPNSQNYAYDKVPHHREPPKPLVISQPKGPSYTLTGSHIGWQQWDFVIGFNTREGLTIHDVRYKDAGKERPILYRASLTETVVPYGDPRPTQRRKNAFDAGEYGMGMCATSLHLGCDCLGYISYLDAHLVTSRGHPLRIPNAICIHEEDNGVLWKHTDRRLPPQLAEVRRARRLVVSSFSTLENYEYGFFWYFYQDGRIEYEIKLTGILSVGASHVGERLPWGTQVAPLVYAPYHQHFFNVRIDFAVDGFKNTVQQVDVHADPYDGEDDQNPFQNAFRTVATELLSERQAKANLSLERCRTWRVLNPTVRNDFGEPVAYRFQPGTNSVPFASPNSWWRKRAGFVNHHVWVTPFKEKERYAAGDFPNQRMDDDGLAKWTAQDRPVANTDLVFWYTFALTHVPRVEEYPIMACATIGFALCPDGFFNANPSLDVPPPPGKGKKQGGDDDQQVELNGVQQSAGCIANVCSFLF